MSETNVEDVRWLLIVRAADFKANPMARSEKIARGYHLNNKLIDFTRNQRLGIRMRVEGLPRF